MAFPLKSWKDEVDPIGNFPGGTAIESAALNDLEERVTDWTDLETERAEEAEAGKLDASDVGAAGEAGKVLAADDPLLSSVVSGSPTGGVPAWAASTEYKLNQLVSSGGVTYICLKAHKSGEAFPGAGEDWAVFAGSASGEALEALEEAVEDLTVSDVVFAEDTHNKSTDVTLGGEAPSEVDYPAESAVRGSINRRASKPAARLATTAALPTNVYANGTAGIGATLTATANAVLTVDGSAVALNDLILVKNEAEAKKNGLYKCTTAGEAGAKYVLTRVADMNSAEIFKGAQVLVTEGSTLAGTLWVILLAGSVTVGTTEIIFTQFAPGAASPPGGLVTPLVTPGLVINGNITVTENLALFTRVVVPKNGTLHDIAAYIGKKEGKAIVAVFDTGDTAAGKYTRLAVSGSIEPPSENKWTTLYDPALPVIRGQQLLLAIVFNNSTATVGRGPSPANSASFQLPAGFIAATGGAEPKTHGQRAIGAFELPASLEEALLVASANAPQLIARVS